MKKFGHKIRKLRQKKDLTLRELGEKLNMSFSILAMYERNERIPPVDKLKMIADFFNVSIDCLLDTGKNIYEKTEKNETEQKNYKIPVVAAEILKDNRTIISDENILEYKTTNIKKDSENLFYFLVKENGMRGSRIFSGDIVLVKKMKNIEDGHIALIIYKNKTMIRTFYKNKNKIILKPESPGYEPLIVDRDEINIIGKIIKVEFEL